MKKSLILGILGLAVGSVATYGQGTIALDTYNVEPGINTVISFNTPSTGLSGPISGGMGYTVGLYYAAGNVTGSVGADGTGYADPSTLGGGLALGTGPNSTATFVAASTGYAGTYLSGGTFVIQPTGTFGSTFTLEVVAYNGATYANSTIRGHSAAFTMPSGDPTAGATVKTGTFMPAFQVFTVVPEPSTLALAGLGLAAFAAYRRKQA